MLFTSCITEKFICKNLESFCHYYFLFQFFFYWDLYNTNRILPYRRLISVLKHVWLTVNFFLHSKLINHTLELKLKSLLLGRRLISLYPDHLIWLQKKFIHIHMFSSSVFIRLSSPRFFTFVCYLHLKQRFYFSSTENSSLDGRKTLSLNTVENLQVLKFILKN